jgi:all-trans-8'-apo-beta-carotenal 15,15'-oxygenase
VLDVACEFPTVAPGREGTPSTYVYAAAGDLGSVLRYDTATHAVQRHALPATQRATEPLFVPRSAGSEDDGWLLALCHDGPTDRAFLAVYDARRLVDGPVARAWFDHQIPITFHGTFAAIA